MTVAGADISNHQAASWRPAKNEKFVYVLATDGHSWFSPTHNDQIKLLRGLGIRVGHYHWLRPGNIQAQVDWFWEHAQPKKGDAVICDWEQAGTTNADKDQFLKLLDAKIPRTLILKRRKNKRLLYCNTNYWLNYDKSGYIGDGLWVARYGTSDPGIQHAWKVWQYTDSPYDRDKTHFVDLKAYDAFFNPSDVAAPVVKIIPVYPSLNAIHTKYGQWGSSWSWNRGKNSAHPTWGQHGGDDWHRGAGDAEIGDPVYAVADGTIIYAGDARKDGGQGWGSAFGIHTLLKWDTGGRTSVDGHMSELLVKTGQKVKAGDKIGKKGKTGNVSGAHVHHEDHLGTRWTDQRVKPIYPGIKVTGDPAPTPAPQPAPVPAPAPVPVPIGNQEDLDVAEGLPTNHRSKVVVVHPTKGSQRFTPPNDDKGNVSVAFGSGLYEIDVYIRVKGKPGDYLQLAGQVATTKQGSSTVVSTTFTDNVPIPMSPPHGYWPFHVTMNVSPAPKGQTRRIRLAAQNFTGHDLTITDMKVYVRKAVYTK